MQFVRTTLTTLVAGLCAMMTSVVFATDATAPVQTIWNAGQIYETIVKMTIDVSNATLTTSSEYKYNGAYSLPHLVFNPVIRFRTDDIRKNGVNYFGRRTYAAPQQSVMGTEGIKWKSEYWMVDPRRWVAAWRMSRNDELKKWKLENEELARRMKDGKVPVEIFAVFYTDDHKEVDFNPDTDSLLLNWTESSVSNFHNGNQGDLIVKVYHAKKDDGSDTLVNASGNIPKAEEEIQRKIVAECNVLSYVLYDDPSGNRRSLLRNNKKWKIDAGVLNKGLLFYGDMDSLIDFEGTLTVSREEIRPSDCEKIRLKPFSGDKICVVNSKGAKAGYHINGRRQPFPLTIDYSRRDDPNANMMEFWFDIDNNVLRYAKIRIVKEDYDGDIPNPRLGKMISALEGSVKGRVAFEIEYWTAVNQPLPEM